MRIRRFLLGGLIVIVVLALVLGAAGAYYFKSHLPNTVAPRALPVLDGEVRLAGLEGPVDIYRDRMGIPHIYAASMHDLFFAQGYVHAQDRFWQMDTWRHIGSGTLSEMFGAGQVETDTFLRTLGWRQIAELEWEQLDDESRAILTAYVDGVNAWLKDRKAEEAGLEYSVLGLLSPDYTIQPWTPINSLTWGKAMAWDLRGNMDEEIARAELLKTLTPEQVNELYPPYPSNHPVIVNNIGEGPGNAALPSAALTSLPGVPYEGVSRNIALLDGVLGPLGDGIGSNSWAVSGALTSTGMPLLANDPHLSIQMPSIWYQVDLQCTPKSEACPFNVGGFSFAGVPGVVIGHNDRIAWGFTNVGPDVMDLYIEKVNPANPDQYEVNGEWVDFETRTETINVTGGESVEITVRSTRHGPVISESYGLTDEGDPKEKEFIPFRERAGIELPEAYVVSLAWTALNPSTPFEAIWGFDKAANWEEFRAAASNFHVPAQNLIYADVDGNIGYQMPGDIPIRAAGDGRLPVPGWTDEYEWTGFIPFEELPYTLNPAEGYIATANNQVHPADYPHLVTTDWDYGFRAARIVELLTTSPGKIDLAYIQEMQTDSFDANGPVFVPLILGLPADPELEPATSLLKGWDYQARADSTPAAVFAAFTRALLRNAFSDDLPEDYAPDGGSRWNQILRTIASDPQNPWWDDKTTPDAIETRDDILKKSVREGLAELKEVFGADSSKWKWGDMHAATFRNQTLGTSGVFLIEDLFNRGPFPVGGGEAIVNATGWSARDGYETNWLPSMRMIVDLGDLNNSLTVHTTGQSGHPSSPHYADMAPMWASGGYYPMFWSQEAVIADSEGHLRLVP